ncbi:hypothetical protein AgCh_023373 [Apium graveolens]
MRGILRPLKDGAPDDDGISHYSHTNSKYVGSEFFSVQLFYGGDFDERLEKYDGGSVAYFDYIPRDKTSLSGLEELFRVLDLENFRIWFLYPGLPLHHTNITLVESDEDVENFTEFVDMYNEIFTMYTTNSSGVYGLCDYDFSITQLALDEREQRVEDMRQDDEKENVLPSQGVDHNSGDEPVDFHADTSNLDTTESEAPVARRRRRVSPPNPPYKSTLHINQGKGAPRLQAMKPTAWLV